LVAIIMGDKLIKTALYPPCGAHASSQDGGGERKVAAQWSCCVKLLGDLPKYKDAIAAVKGGKVQTGWANKIKNRLRTMASITREYNKEMGQTGAGIKNAAEIDMSLENKFTS
ncbi:hypothetical protein C8J57DRAFT_965668, partial [Mycena rebaudengoi]